MSKGSLFPEKLAVKKSSKKVFKMPKKNGGWGDSRDHKLCLQHVLNETSPFFKSSVIH